MGTHRDANSLAIGAAFVLACLAFTIATALVLYATYALAMERRIGAALEHQMSTELALETSLEHRFVPARADQRATIVPMTVSNSRQLSRAGRRRAVWPGRSAPTTPHA